jgi:hypothetical protein
MSTLVERETLWKTTVHSPMPERWCLQKTKQMSVFTWLVWKAV